MKTTRTLSIIGIGPRGLYALENLILELNAKQACKQIHILLFEETGHFGNGQVYDVDQVKTNWINISERILNIKTRPQINLESIIIPSFPSYHDWDNKDFSKLSNELKDTYPPRAKIGKYLKERFDSLAKPLIKLGLITLFKERVIKVNLLEDKTVAIETHSGIFHNADELLLTIGHQPTRLSKQLAHWKAALNNNTTLFIEPYPIVKILEHIKPTNTIAIRGFGLAAIDVIRSIASNTGTFIVNNKETQEIVYRPKNDAKIMFIPFSLNGLPVVPKPLSAKIDNYYKPTNKQLDLFSALIGNSETQKQAKNFNFLIEAITPIIAKIYAELPLTKPCNTRIISAIETHVKNWLKNESYKAPSIVENEQSTALLMRNYIEMAKNTSEISLDFCIGQVWRHCQPYIYEQLSFNECSPEVFAEIIGLDERMKRYAYGPPVESIQQMLALLSAGIMTTDYINNPEITLDKKGWYLSSNNNTILARVMINSVLDSPKVKQVNSELVNSLFLNELIKPAHDDYGIETDSNGYIIPKNDTNGKTIPIALLGRLAKGTIIGVDAILECFGDRPKDWAKKAAFRHQNWLN